MLILSSSDVECTLVLLTATIGNPDTLIHWLDNVNKEKKCKKVVRTHRPVPLRTWFIDNTKCRNFKKTQKKTKTEIKETRENNRLDVIQNMEEPPILTTNDPTPEQYDLMLASSESYDKVKKYWNKLGEQDYNIKFELQTMCNQIASNENLGFPCIIFVFSKAKCIEYGHMIEQSYVDHAERSEILSFYDENLREFKENSQYIELRKIIQNGVAYHHSGLLPKIREVVEFLLKKRLVKFLFGTSSVAIGVNFPVKTVVVTALNIPSEDGFRNLFVSEYKQLSGRAGRRFIDDYGNILIFLLGNKKILSWNEVNNIMNGSIDNITSKYVIEPIFILKNIDDQIHKLISSKSFAYYKSHRNEIKELTIPTKLKKIFDLKFQMIALEENGLKCNMKGFTKLHKALSDDDKKEYEDLMKLFEDNKKKTDLDHYDDFENSIYAFLENNDFITREDDKFKLTEKGQMADQFSEINPIIFVNDMNYILKEDVLETLSMFIDDGLKESEDSVGSYENATINYFIEKTEMIYSEYIKKYPKWNFYPVNYVFLQYWLSDENISLDQASKQFGYDQGAIVKVLVKMYQICDELITNLTRINRTDMVEYINERKQLLIRYPLKLESLYVNY